MEMVKEKQTSSYKPGAAGSGAEESKFLCAPERFQKKGV